MGLLTLSTKFDWDSYIISTAETASEKIGALIRCIKFLCPELGTYLCESIIRPCMEYFVMCGLVPLVATWNC